MKYFLLICIVVGIMSCGGGDTTSGSDSKTSSINQSEGADTVDVLLELVSSDQMKFDKSSLSAKTGEVVRVVLTHTGSLDKNAMGHNFVLIDQNVDVTTFAMSAMKASDTEYIPTKNQEQMVAYTGLIGGGESTSTTFYAPDPGTYTYICTFPGHYGMMKGEFVVTE